MKPVQRKVLAVSALLLSLCSIQHAQAQDPVEVNAKFIQLKLDNGQARVFESTLAPGDREQMHAHPASIVYVLAGGKSRNHSADGKTSEAELHTGDTVYREAMTHWAENVGETTIRVLVIELKEAAK